MRSEKIATVKHEWLVKIIPKLTPLIYVAEIHDYIAQENPQAVRRVILLIRKAAETLPQNPQIGRVGRIAGTHELTVGRFPFMLAYRIESEEIQVLAVVHTARLWPENF